MLSRPQPLRLDDISYERSDTWAIGPNVVPSTAITTAKYVYFYSVVNTAQPFTGANTNEDNLIRFYVHTNNLHTSYGVLQGGGLVTAFTDAETQTNGSKLVGANNNQLLGGVSNNNTADPYTLDGQPTRTISQDNPVPTIGITTSPPGDTKKTANDWPQAAVFVNTTTDPLYNMPALQFSFTLGPSQFSTLMFFTSNVGPGYGGGVIQGGVNDNDPNGSANHSGGDVPTPTPEPTSLVLLGLGLAPLGFGYVRRLRAAKVAAEVS